MPYGRSPKQIGLIFGLLVLLGLLSACFSTGELVYVTPDYLLDEENDQNSSFSENSSLEGGEDGEPIPVPTELVDLIGSGAAESMMGIMDVENMPAPSDYAWVAVGRGFDSPLFLTHAGDGTNRLFVLEQGGRIWEIQEDLTIDEEPFLDIGDRILVSFEQGLLGLAFPQDFEIRGEFYVNYTDVFGNTVVSRFATDRFKEQAVPELESALFNIEQPEVNNNGGQLVFGPDEFLYVALGDGGGAGDRSNNAQSLDSLFGKILRVDVDLGEPYAIPAANPYFGLTELPEIWAIGLRNPKHFSFDRLTGDMYIADQGHRDWEEINFLSNNSLGGANFGWNYFEGAHIYGELAPNIAFADPVAEYNHVDVEEGCDIIGGYVYRGSLMPEWDGVYFFADRCSGVVFGMIQTGFGQWQTQALFDFNFQISSFGEDEAGELYLVDFDNGDIYRFEKR